MYSILNFYLQIKVFCDTGAERKARNEERRANKRKMNNTGGFHVHLFFDLSFYTSFKALTEFRSAKSLL